MRRWLLIGCGGVLVLCVGCAGIVVFVLRPRAQDSMADTMADAVAASMAGTVASSGPGPVILTADDLDINNSSSTESGCGFNVVNSDTTIHGVETEITPNGLTFGCEGIHYSTTPVVENGRLELTQTDVSSGLFEFLLPTGKFEAGLEEGINRALDQQGLTPTEVTLRDGSMIIVTETSSL
jgi:hypothetical protein